jgi:RNA polymerase sigma-70 factor (ECF subfamily)
MPSLKPAPGEAEAAAPARLSDPETWLDQHGDYLMGYALLRLRDRARAEDLVQETFLAALKGRASFGGRASERSWLVGILKNKIIDHYRSAARETSFTDLEFLNDEMRDCFIQEGAFKDGWIHERGPMEWNMTPGASLDREAFWKAFHECAGKLPKNLSHVFLLREVDDVSTEDICATMRITPNNLWVMLHRARMALRRCLETNWFAPLGQPGRAQ